MKRDAKRLPELSHHPSTHILRFLQFHADGTRVLFAASNERLWSTSFEPLPHLVLEEIEQSPDRNGKIRGDRKGRTYIYIYENCKKRILPDAMIFKEFNLRWNDVPRTSRTFYPKIVIFSQF